MRRTKRDIIVDMMRELSNRLDAELAFTSVSADEIAARHFLNMAENAIHRAWPDEANKDKIYTL